MGGQDDKNISGRSEIGAQVYELCLVVLVPHLATITNHVRHTRVDDDVTLGEYRTIRLSPAPPGCGKTLPATSPCDRKHAV